MNRRSKAFERVMRIRKRDTESHCREDGQCQVVTTSPALRQWMKMITTIGAAPGGLRDLAKREDSDDEEDKLFMQRVTTRYSKQTGESNKEEAVRMLKNEDCHKWVVSPDGSLLFYWLFVLSVIVYYNWWTIILRQSFEQTDMAKYPVWTFLDVFGDFLLFADVGIQLRTGYLEQGLLVTSFRKLAKRYVFSLYFLLDVVSLLPLQSIAYVSMSTNNPDHNTTMPILRFIRLFKSYRIVSFYHMMEMRASFPNLIRVGNLTHILLLGVHWFACFHYIIVSKNQEVYQAHSAKNISSYLLSLYWSTLTLTTIGNTTNPHTNAEYIFAIVSYLIGIFVFATIVGQVGNVITNQNASRLEFERLLDGAKFYMRNHGVPKDMQSRVQRWYDYSWSRGRMTGGSDIQSLSVLPVKLKTELALQVNLNTLKKVSIFKECQPEFLHDLVLKMCSVIFTPGDIVCRRGEIAREMYIIADGVIQIITDDGSVLRTLRSGDFFGEIGILNLGTGLNRRTADVRSLGYSELFSLSRDEVLTAMKDHPEAAELLRDYGQRRLEESRLVPSFNGGLDRLTTASRHGAGSGASHGGSTPLNVVHPHPVHHNSHYQQRRPHRSLSSVTNLLGCRLDSAFVMNSSPSSTKILQTEIKEEESGEDEKDVDENVSAGELTDNDGQIQAALKRLESYCPPSLMPHFHHDMVVIRKAISNSKDEISQLKRERQLRDILESHVNHTDEFIV